MNDPARAKRDGRAPSAGQRPTACPRLCDAAAGSRELAMMLPCGGPRRVGGANLPTRATIQPQARVALVPSAAPSRRSWRGSSRSASAKRTRSSATSKGMHARSFKRTTFAKLAYAELLLFRRCEQLPPAHLHRAEGGNLQARHQTTQGLARPHSARQTRDCTPRCPARCPYCPLGPRLQPLSLSCGPVHALSAGVAHSTRRACTLLLDYKLAQRYGLALATPVRRRVALAARSAARRRARWH